MTDDLALDMAFLDNLAHQLIAPLQTIQGHCLNIIEGVVPREDHNKKLKEVVGHIKILIEMARRVRFLHELLAATSSSSAPAIALVPFSEIVTQFIDSFNNYNYLLLEKGIKVDIDTRHMNTLPEVANWKAATQQIIMNLFDNAAKYCYPNTTISVSAVKRGRSHVELTFATRSVQIPENERTKIFGSSRM